MPTAIEKNLEVFQANCYPAMLEDLGKSLGVTGDSLKRLALGWVPVVEFKKGKNFQGWFVIAERDSEGVPVGLSLRSQNGMKVMAPGSKHGLIYEINEHHTRGSEGYQAGAANWIRTMDAGINCPVCGKPDGCLLSSENPADPKSVICIREKDGAEKPMRFGHLHILKDEGRVNGVSALADHGGPVLIVEGMSDVAASLDLGFDAVGRPSNLACLDILCDLVRGRTCIVVGENDTKFNHNTGKNDTPGVDGMLAAFQTIKKVSKGATYLLPPENVKDLRAWVSKYGLTREKFLEHHTEHGKDITEDVVLPDARPLTVARSYLKTQHTIAGRVTIRRWAGTWYQYKNSKYEEIKPDLFRQPLYPWAHDKFVNTVDTKTGNASLKPLVANTGMLMNVEDAIISETLVQQPTLPCWINGARGPSTKDIIVFNNGILDVNAFLGGKSEKHYLLDSTPDLFTTVALPFAFDPTAACPTWKSFIASSLGDDRNKLALLREWFGYCLTPDTSFQKLMYLRGPSGAGKSVILNMLCRMVGEEQSASTSFADLAGDFGVQSLVGKMICVIPDARTPRRSDSMRGLELLLNITSGDGIQINRKFKDPIERHKLISRISIASNEFLEVPDHAGAMLRRLNVIEFARSFVGQEDWHLEEKLIPEIPGIAVWALAGLRQLRQAGKFTLPESSVIALQEWRRTTSPMAGFLEECTEQAADGEVLKDELFDAWSRWADERHITLIGKGRFLERVRSNAPYAISESEMRGGHKFSTFRGIQMQRWAARKFLGRP